MSKEKSLKSIAEEEKELKKKQKELAKEKEKLKAEEKFKKELYKNIREHFKKIEITTDEQIIEWFKKEKVLVEPVKKPRKKKTEEKK